MEVVKATVIIGLDLVGTKSRGRVYITGQVRAPGSLELMPGDPMTLSQAILRAGSLGDFADKHKIRLVRKKENLPPPKAIPVNAIPGKEKKRKPGMIARIFGAKEDTTNDSTETIIVDIVEILEKGHLERDPELKVGDLIYVPEKLINF